MNIRRGLFRIWLILSLLFVIVIVILLGPDVKKEFQKGAQFADVVWDLPVERLKARGSVGVDYAVLKSQPNICWYEPARFRKLFPEYNDLSDSELAQKLNSRVGIANIEPQPWKELIRTIGIAIGAPLAVLIIGSGFLWAIVGFKKTN